MPHSLIEKIKAKTPRKIVPLFKKKLNKKLRNQKEEKLLEFMVSNQM